MQRRLPVIFNPQAGAGAGNDTEGRIRNSFESIGIGANLLAAGNGLPMSELVRRAAGRSPIVVAAGGDGTISSVAAELAGTGKVLGILPAGTLNHFAQDLKIPSDLGAAAEVIARGEARCVDVGEVNGRVFINNCGVGLYPAIARKRQQLQEAGWGRAHMAIEKLAGAGADLLLAGHIHRSHAGQIAERRHVHGYAALIVQPGTAASTRRRGEFNSFNLLRIERPRVTVEHFSWHAAAASFRLTLSQGLLHTERGWKQEPAGSERL